MASWSWCAYGASGTVLHGCKVLMDAESSSHYPQPLLVTTTPHLIPPSMMLCPNFLPNKWLKDSYSGGATAVSPRLPKKHLRSDHRYCSSEPLVNRLQRTGECLFKLANTHLLL
ncbi:hypothetical protein VFPPC_18053 [Pochonia chlamydosporia 170]|uniref:Uncharacterized protein n=1 Tax=Pochonia chlamydosporia 170 TaxID=1380566 RepID=A0A219APR6_METCM|nr:hypothetical protein VFPPC_18053 [Pochonia chlamydosporia 170]OWT42798.1 hypothetical protein VFPPC_18053 [Pochonia chlamydosporia 170]